MQIPIFLPNKGVVLNKPDEFLLPYFSPHSRNMEYVNELIQGRLGLTKFDTSALPGQVQLIDQYWKFTGVWYLMFATTKDICRYDFGENRFDFLTPVYTAGTIEVKTGELNKVYGTDTLWDDNLKEGDYIKIGAGDVHTGSTWYEIAEVNSDTLLTLTSNAPITPASTEYVARKTFTGLSTDYWQAITFTDDILGDTWIATNGKDKPIRYTGGSQVQALANLPTGFTAAKYIGVFKGRVMFAWTVEAGNQPQRERWSAVGYCEDYGAIDAWKDGDFHDFADDIYWITGICNYADYHIVFKERDAHIGRWVGGSYTFDYEKSSSCTGCYSAYSIVVKDYIYYYGIDNKFKKWNLLREEDLFGDELFPFTRDFNPNLEQYIYGWDLEYRNQIRWFVPHSDTDYHNYCIVYDYAQDIMQIWEYEQGQALSCIGEYLNEADLYVNDPIWGEYYVDEQDGYWDDRLFLANAPVIIYGGYDGYIRNADIGYKDDGETYQRLLRLSRINFDKPDYIKRLKDQQWWLETQTSGSVTISLKKDDSLTWEAQEKSISLVDADKDIIKKDVTWNKHAQNFQFQVEAENHFALLGFLNDIHIKRKTI